MLSADAGGLQALGDRAPLLVMSLVGQICGRCDSMLVGLTAKAAHWLVHAIPVPPDQHICQPVRSRAAAQPPQRSPLAFFNRLTVLLLYNHCPFSARLRLAPSDSWWLRRGSMPRSKSSSWRR